MNQWRRYFGPGSNETGKQELDAEIEAHLAMAAADARERGLCEEAARHEAQREFGNIALVKDVTRESWGWMWLERLTQDIRYSLRQMRKSWGFAAAVVGTLALGMGAATAMFTVVDRVLLRPLPYQKASRLMEIEEVGRGEINSLPTYLDLEEWRRWSRSFAEIGFYYYARGRNFLESNANAQQVGSFKISTNLFEVLGVAPAMGRDFRGSPDGFARTADTTSVILSDGAWREVLGSDPSVLGKTVKISGQCYTVVGVMPRGFSFPFDAKGIQAWTLAQLGDEDRGRTDQTPGYSVIGRLVDGTTPAQAQAELSTMQKGIVEGYVDADERKDRSGIAVKAYTASLVDKDVKRALETLLAASALLWLIGCVNATNLLLARATVRRREIAMRGALGASRGRIVQQFLVEDLLLSGAGALAGAVLALTAVKVFAHNMEHRLPFPVPAAVDWRVALTLLGLTVESQEVVRVQAGAGDGRSHVECAVWSVPVVLVQPGAELLGALL